MLQSCKHCKQTFEITDDDLTFYDEVSPVLGGKKFTIPPPEICPQCRAQERYVWRPELHVFLRRSDCSGKQILSMYPPVADCKAYAPDEWWSDAWNPLDFGSEFDFNRPFFEQFRELLRTVPVMSVSVDANENCDYVNSASWNRNCYLISGANHNEDCYYGNFVNYCRDCIDCSFLDHCELCYECIDCAKCYNLRESQNCSNCSDSAFLYSCRGCKHCFGSVNLAEREHVFLNEQLSKEDYERRIAGLELHRRSRVAEAKTFFNVHRLRYPHRYMVGEMNEDVTGNGILRSRRAHDCYDVSDLEDCKYCAWFHQSKNCMDCYAWGFPSEECYSCMEAGGGCNRVLFSCVTYNGSNVLYCYQSKSAHDVFGCVSMRRNSYCVLNKQYSKEKYELLVPKIIEHMQRTGEWGKFFPMSLCPLSYNQTIAQDYVPITKERALSLGAKWSDEKAAASVTNETIPDSIHDTDASICEKVLTCSATNKPYKMIPQEFQFYKQNDIPVPDRAFFQRHEARLKKRNPRQLWNRSCMKCRRVMRTSFAPERPEKIYCEECYLKEIH
ncbi:hypothetical protein HYR82_01210 [Candidatus Peregrinibacteria bacterium]|nr:hypothetical protein [Candidatus Peregrinibacteria bacterium]